MAFLLQRTFSLHLHGYDMRRILGAMACFVAISAFAQSEPGVQQNCQAAPDGVLDQTSKYGGSTRLALTAFPMVGDRASSFPVSGAVRGFTTLKIGTQEFSVEWSGFRPFNVENIAASQDARAVTKGQSLNDQFALTLDKHSGSAAKNANNKNLKNVGPSVQYKLRDKTGQAREYQNYMQPVTIDGAEVFLAGMRVNPSDPFSYLRIPADEDHSVKQWMRLRAALADPALRELAAQRYASRAMPSSAEGEALARQLQQSSARTLAIFAGQGSSGGYAGVAAFLEKIAPTEQEKAANIFMKILNGTMWELWQAAREKDGLAPSAGDQNHARFLQLATNALSDSFFYGAPVYLQLDEFVEVKASVLQVTRSPGKAVVYFGCVLLVLGVFAMFYIRERRLWVWLRDDEGGGASALMAMSTQRKTLDFDNEFNDLKAKLPQSA